MKSKIYKNGDGAGIYIHVPFCISKCPYCDFYSVEGVRQQDRYVRALQTEARNRMYELADVPIQSIYFGGGTPSLLSHIDVGQIMMTLRECYDLREDIEVTMECNPGDISQLEIEKHISHGINRFSIGAQSFHPQLLNTLGRRHSAEDTIRMFGYFRNLGVTNISLDLIYGIPGETLEMVEQDVDRLIALNPEHISAYHLIYEEGTPFFMRRDSGELKEVDEELSIQMSAIVRERIVAAGYKHYEISNFAKPCMQSRHNSLYWRGLPYIGFGPSAHSYIHPWRSSNQVSINEYNRLLINGAKFLPRQFDYITPEIEYEEYLLTRLRTSDGISLEEICKLGKTPNHELIEEMINKGWMEKKGERLVLTEKGIDLSDAIILKWSLM